MMRHSVIYAAGLVEPDPSGVWVKHQEAVAEHSALSAALKIKEQQLLALEREHKNLQAEHAQSTVELNAIINRQEKSLRAAKARLQIHGHSGNCASRTGRISADGIKSVGACSCGLDQWMTENRIG